MASEAVLSLALDLACLHLSPRSFSGCRDHYLKEASRLLREPEPAATPYVGNVAPEPQDAARDERLMAATDATLPPGEYEERELRGPDHSRDFRGL